MGCKNFKKRVSSQSVYQSLKRRRLESRRINRIRRRIRKNNKQKKKKNTKKTKNNKNNNKE